MAKKDELQQAYRKYEKDLAFMPRDVFSKLGESMQIMAISMGKMEHEKRRVIAEVTKVKGYCVADYKKGDKLVFNMLGMFLPDESSVKVVCAWLLGDLIPVFAANECLMGYGVEFEQPYYDIMECSDPGPPSGWGHIKVKLHMEQGK